MRADRETTITPKKSGGLVPPARELSPKRLREMVLWMAFLRRIDERLIVLQRQGRIGFHGSAFGEEACVIGTAMALAKQDVVVPALRQGAIMLMRGFALRTYIAQSFGCALDELCGRQMPAHFASRSVHQVSWSSCIGNQIPQAVGIAYAFKLQKVPRVAVGFMGDGATSEADFHYAMNFAGVWKPPCVLICQNNQWAISSPVSAQSAESEIWKKAAAYGVPGARIDGNDVEAVFTAVSGAVEKARAGGGPTLLELFTYRMGAHSTSDDPSVYRDEEAGKRWFAQNDPIPRALAKCETLGVLTSAEMKHKISARDRELEEAIAECEAAALPERSSLFDDVYSSNGRDVSTPGALPWHLAEQRDELLATPPQVRHPDQERGPR